jgi:hypothetical protein
MSTVINNGLNLKQKLATDNHYTNIDRLGIEYYQSIIKSDTSKLIDESCLLVIFYQLNLVNCNHVHAFYISISPN